MSVNYQSDRIELHHGDCIEEMRKLPDCSVDAVVTDPPYALGFMGKEWDSFGDTGRGSRARVERATEVTPTGTGHTTSAGPYLAAGIDSLRSAGMPFQRWSQAWATEAFRVLKPGGHLLAFGGTRTWHRLAVAVEDAGFEMRDSIAWLYGCLSDDTEILTDTGWVHYDKASEGQHALALDTATGTLEWQPIQHVHRYWHDGEMVRLHGDHTDQLLTPNHRVVLDNHNAEPCIPYASGLRDMRDGVLEAERLGQEGEGALLLPPMQRGPAGPRVGNPRAQGESSADAGKLPVGSSEDDGRGESGMAGRRYRIQEARELCRRAVRESAGVGAANGPQGRLHHGAPPTDGGHVRLPADTGRGYQPREPRPEGQSARELDALADEPGAQAVRVGEVRRGSGLPSTRVEAEWVGYAGVVWCITVPHGAFIARRNGLIFATGNSGFPKSLDVSKAIDKSADYRLQAEHRRSYVAAVERAGLQLPGNSRHDWTSAEHAPGEKWWATFCAWLPTLSGEQRARIDREVVATRTTGIGTGNGTVAIMGDGNRDITGPATDAARQWQGWGTALKPAFEPIVVARKPLIGTVAANVTAHGTGALNIDATRIGPRDSSENTGGGNTACTCPVREASRPARTQGTGNLASSEPPCGDRNAPPANALFGEIDCPSPLDSLAGYPFLSRSDGERAQTAEADAPASLLPPPDARGCLDPHGSSVRSPISQPMSCPKHTAGNVESLGRWPANVVLDESQAEALDAQTGVMRDGVTVNRNKDAAADKPASVYGTYKQNAGEDVGYGNSGGASRFFYVAKAGAGERPKLDGQGHPTVKPLSLMRWLVRLVTPPGGTVLEPFLGSGTTVEACIIEGFRCVGIERDEAYLRLVMERLNKTIQPDMFGTAS